MPFLQYSHGIAGKRNERLPVLPPTAIGQFRIFTGVSVWQQFCPGGWKVPEKPRLTTRAG
jgi:hypothetical protein